MTLALDIVLSGLVLGGMYALIALGLTLQYGIARIMNLSYGEFLVAAAFAALYLYSGMAVNPIVGLIVVVPASFAANWLLYQIVLMPLVKRAENQGMLEVDSILGTFGILFVIQGVMLLTFGGTLQSYSYLSVPVHILGTTLALNQSWHCCLRWSSVVRFIFCCRERATVLRCAQSRSIPTRHAYPASTFARPPRWLLRRGVQSSGRAAF